MMRILVACALISTLAIVAIPAQVQVPRDGDLIISVNRSYLGGSLDVMALHLSAGTKPSWSTLRQLAQPMPLGGRLDCVRMARDNNAVVISYNPQVGWSPPGSLLSLNVNSLKMTTLAALPSTYLVNFELDPDGWIAAGAEPGLQNSVWLLRDTSPGPITPSRIGTWPQSGSQLLDVAIHRDGPASRGWPYVLAVQDTRVNTLLPRLLRTNRGSGLSTVIATSSPTRYCPLSILNAVEVDPLTGDYLTCDWSGFVCRVDAKSQVTTLHTTPGPSHRPDDARFTQDGQVWVAVSSVTPALFKMDATGTVSTIFKVPTSATSTVYVKGIEIYGARRLNCKGKGQPGSKIQISLSSRRPGDAGQLYQLACSFRRQPPFPRSCWQFPNGEYLFLDNRTDPLFKLTALNLCPAIFRKFAGVTDASGNAVASVAIPADFPKNTGITIFVAGVIFSAQQGVHTVTNTHWFVLN